MMACKGIVCGRGVRGGNCLSFHRGSLDLVNHLDNASSRLSFVIPDRQRRCLRYISAGKLCVSAAKQDVQIRKEEKRRMRKGEKESVCGIGGEKLDEWMRESVVDIVKNLAEAPLLVHVYGGSNGTMRTKTEKAEKWESVKRKWEKGEEQLPEGMIFIEKLEDEHRIRKELLIEVDDKEDGDRWGDEEEEESTKAFGIVVQGRGMDCGPVCYLLKTCRVGSGSGLGSGSGICCTHFCLVRVQSFRETTESQLTNCWLSQLQLQGGQ